MSTHEEWLGSYARGSPISHLVTLSLSKYICCPYTSYSAMMHDTVMHSDLDNLQKAVVELDRGSEESLYHTSDVCQLNELNTLDFQDQALD